MGVETDNTKQTPVEDMRWSACIRCGCVQLAELIESSVLYATPHNPAIGSSWLRHHTELSQLISETLIKGEILEIGGANLQLANQICRKNEEIKYTVLDYSCGKYDAASVASNITQLNFPFEEYESSKKYDAVVHSHMLEHAYDPLNFLEKIKNSLKPTAKMIFSVPNIAEQIKSNHTNALNFEHTYYLDEEYLSMLLWKSGFKIEKVYTFSRYNNFYVCSSTAPKNLKHTNTQLAAKLLINFAETLEKDVESLNRRLAQRRVYVFGAHIFTQYLLASGLKEERIIAVLDNDCAKIGKYLAGTGLKVLSPSELRDKSAPSVILRASQFNSEIRKQLKDINRKVELL